MVKQKYRHILQAFVLGYKFCPEMFFLSGV